MTTNITNTTTTINTTMMMITMVTVMTDKALRRAYLGAYEKYEDELKRQRITQAATADTLTRAAELWLYTMNYAKEQVHILKDPLAIGGHRWIYENLLERLAPADIATSAEHLGLALNDLGEAEVPFLGTTYLVSNKGVRQSDGKGFKDAIGSVLIHYILKGSGCRPAGKFVTFAELAGPLFKHGSYSSSALERPIIKRFQGRIPELLVAAASYGGHQAGEAGLGAVSLIIELLPHIPLQLIFYDRDDEFPARTTLLYDQNATQLIDFEVLAVLVTAFVQSLTKL